MVSDVVFEPVEFVAVIVAVQPEVKTVGVPVMLQVDDMLKPVGSDVLGLQEEGVPPVLVTLIVAA
jgi:hypothetical protein